MSYNLLKGKRGIIFGALNEQSIAWKVAEKAVEEGATITLSNTPVAVRMGEVSALAEKLNCEVIAADATSVEDLENVFKRSMEVLGGQVDFVLHSIGMSPNVRKKRTYDDLDYDMLDKTLDISAISFHKMIQAAKKMNAIAEYGSIVALSCDTIMIIGAYSLFWGILPFSLEIDQTFIGAILTAIGYSINDKVVIFDRVREFFGLYPKRDKRVLFNDSLNTTLARTINTSLSTLIVLLCIFILGGDSIRSFAFAMILGVVIGTLSSLFIASPIAYNMMKNKKVVVPATEE